MKKVAASVLALVLVVSLSLVAFVACNPKDSEKASNADVLGTTVAVMASQMTGGATTAADDKADATFNAGVNLDVSNGASLSFSSELVAAGIGKALQPAIQGMVDKLDTVLNDNGIKVEKVDSNDAEYTEKFSISYTYVDEKTGKEATRELALYIKLSEGAELEGKKDYSFDAKVTLVVKGADDAEAKEVFLTSFSGKATFDKAKDTTVFTLGASAGANDSANAFANVKAYATAKGTVKIEMGAGASISETLGASAGLSVEVGKLDNNKYGAIVTANGQASVTGITSVDFVATINVYANGTDNAGEFVLNGNLEINATVPVLGSYKGTATLTGKAVYDATKDEAVVGLNGTINFQKVENENNK